MILNSCDNCASESSETAPYCGYRVVHEGDTGAEELPDEIRLVSHLLLAWKEEKQTQQKILLRNKSARGKILPGTEQICCSPRAFENLLGSLRKTGLYVYVYVYVLLPSPCPVGDKVREQRAGTSPWFHAAEGWLWKGKRLAICNDWEKPVYSFIYRGCHHVFWKQGSLPVLPLTWTCLLVLGCFGDSLKSVEIYCFIKYTK